MNEKLQKILEDVLQDEAKANEFAKLQTVDEMYAYFAEKIPGLSESEFDSFIVEMMEGYSENEEAIQNIDVASLADVAGGAHLGAKIASGALAVLSLFPTLGTGASAANVKKPSPKATSSKVVAQKVEQPTASAPASPVSEAPAPAKLPEPSNKFPASKSWIRRHPIAAGVLTIGTLVLSYLGAKQLGWIGGKVKEAPTTIPAMLPPSNSSTSPELYNEEFERAISFFESAYEYLPDIQEDSPKDELFLYHNALVWKNNVNKAREQLKKGNKNQVSEELFGRLEIELNRVEERCNQVIQNAKQDVKNTEGKLECLQQLVNSRQAYADSTKTNEALFEEFHKLSTNKQRDNNRLTELYKELESRSDQMTVSDSTKFAEVRGIMSGLNIDI